MAEQDKKIALVTGAGGYIGSAIVRELTQQGFQVRGTVRSVADASKIAHLTSNFPDLELFEADLLIPDSFDKACQGCDVVFHSASPFQLVVNDPQKDLVDPALNGTLNVLNSCLKAGVKRVIVTSSVAAVVGNPPHPEYTFSEADWNQDSTLQSSPYRFSKAVAERAAWEFASQHGLELSTVNPSFVLGPPLSSRVDSTSVAFCKEILNGNTPFALCMGCVDLRDVALAHVRSFQRPEAIGKRFIVSSQRPFIPAQLIQALIDSGRFQDRPLDRHLPLPAPPSPLPYLLSHDLAKQHLGIEFRDPLETFVEMAQSLIQLGIVE